VAFASPVRQDAFCVTVLSGPANVIHHLVRPFFRQRTADACGDIVERLVPTHPRPAILSAAPAAFQWIKDAIGIGCLVERRRSLRAVPSSGSRMFGVALVLADLQRLAVDVGKKAAGRFAVEASGWNEHVVALDTARP